MYEENINKIKNDYILLKILSNLKIKIMIFMLIIYFYF